MHKRRKGMWRGFGGWPFMWLFLMKISTSLWLAGGFQGLENIQHIEGWAVYFPCVVFMY